MLGDFSGCLYLFCFVLLLSDTIWPEITNRSIPISVVNKSVCTSVEVERWGGPKTHPIYCTNEHLEVQKGGQFDWVNTEMACTNSNSSHASVTDNFCFSQLGMHAFLGGGGGSRALSCLTHTY